MEISLLIFWLLLLGAAICTALVRVKPALAWPTATGLTALSLLTWLIRRPQLPFESTFLPGSAAGFLPDWTWHVETTAWEITAWILLLMIAFFLQAALQSSPSHISPASSLLLASATLTAIWSDSFMGLLAGLTLLLAIWLAALWRAGERDNAFIFRGAVLLMGLLLAWPIGSSRTALLATALLLNIWPLPLWQPQTSSSQTDVTHLTPLLPPLAGALLLLRLLPVAKLSPGVSLLLTVLSLVGFMQGIRLAWGRLHLPNYAITALLLAQAHLLLLAGWFACLILYITARQVNWGRNPPDVSRDELSNISPEKIYKIGPLTLPVSLPLRLLLVLAMLWLISTLLQRPDFSLPAIAETMSYLSLAILALVGLGILGLAVTSEPLKAGMAVLMFLTGFELFFSALDQSATMLIVLAAVTLMLALAVSYLVQMRYAVPTLLDTD